MRVMLLGSGGALSSARRSHTSLAVVGDRPLLVDCSSNSPWRLEQLGVDWLALERVLLTHRHPDHLYGLPSLVQQLYIAALDPEAETAAGRGPLRLVGPESALAVASTVLEAFGLRERDDMFEVRLEPRPSDRPEASSLEDCGLELTTFPVAHGAVPTLGLRLAPRGEPERAVVYSSDTEPCRAVIEHSQGAALLLQECSFIDGPARPGHTGLEHIGEIVEQTGARKIVLVHLPPMDGPAEGRVRRSLTARYGGRVTLGEDGQVFEV